MNTSSCIVIDGRAHHLPRQLEPDTINNAMRSAGTTCKIINAKVSGSLLCANTSIGAHVEFEHCEFSNIDFSNSRFEHGLTLRHCSGGIFSFREASAHGPVIIDNKASSDETTGQSVPHLVDQLVFDRANIDGSLWLRDVTVNSLRCVGTRVTGDMVCKKLKTSGLCYLAESDVTGKLDLQDAHIGGACSLRLAHFAWITADRARVDGEFECSRINVGDSLFARDMKLLDSLHLKGARIGGQIILHGSIIEGDLDLSGLRAFGFHMKRAIIRKSLRARGIDLLDSLLAKHCSLQGEIVIKGAAVSELSFVGCTTNTIDLFNITVLGSAVFGREEKIEQAGERLDVGQKPNKHATLAEAAEIENIIHRDCLTSSRLWCHGLRCRSLDLFNTQIEYLRLGNVQVESVLDLALLDSNKVTIAMSKIGGNLRGAAVKVLPSSTCSYYNGTFKIRSSEIVARTDFAGAEIARFESSDSRFESLAFSELSGRDKEFSRAGRLGSAVNTISLEEVIAINIDISSADRLASFEMRSSVAERLDFAALAVLPNTLHVEMSKVNSIVLDKAPEYLSKRERRKSVDRYENCSFYLAATTYSTMICDVTRVLQLWNRRSSTPSRSDSSWIRPALAVLHRTLRFNGYDDWADGVYRQFRETAGTGTRQIQLQVRNWFSQVLFGYGYSTTRTAMTILIPIILFFLITLVDTDSTAVKTGTGTVKPVYMTHATFADWVARAANVAELVVRSFIPGGGEPSSLVFRSCEASHPQCIGTWTFMILRTLGIICIPMLLVAFGGLTRYGERRS